MHTREGTGALAMLPSNSVVMAWQAVSADAAHLQPAHSFIPF